MELQEELSRQLQLQKKLQAEMESLMSSHAEVRDESAAANSKMGAILALKRKLQHELQAHLRMQHQLLSQLNQVVLPAVERLHTGSDGENGHGMVGGIKSESVLMDAAAWANADGMEEGEEEDDDEDEDDEPAASPVKRRRQ